MSFRILNLISFALLVSRALPAQVDETLRVGDTFVIYSGDSMVVAFNCTGHAISKSCSKYYRIGRRDSIHAEFSGAFKDYYSKDGSLAMSGTIANGQLNGPARYFYQGGGIREEGVYKDGYRLGEWKYYYSSGALRYRLVFDDNSVLIPEALDENGSQVVANGNGHIVLEFRVDLQCDYFMAEGDVVNGKMHGSWTMFLQKAIVGRDDRLTTEVFDKGKFITGSSPTEKVYTKRPHIVLRSFYANENFRFDDATWICPGPTYWPVGFEGDALSVIFYPSIEANLKKYNARAADQWLAVAYLINEKGSLTDVQASSSIGDEKLEATVRSLVFKIKGKWRSAVQDKKPIAVVQMFTILVRNGRMSVPFLTQPLTRPRKE